MEKFSPALAQRERWLVLNKYDLIPEERAVRTQEVLDALDWQGPVYTISALNRRARLRSVATSMTHIEARRAKAKRP